MKPQSTFSELLQAYFTQRLMGECNASPHTIANYRDAFRLLIAFTHKHLKKPPKALTMQDLDASLVCRFLDHLEKDRGISVRSRNAHLAAIHSFFNYVALQEPAQGASAQRILAIKSKRCTKKPVDFLTRVEAEALLSAPNQESWSGRRDRALLLLTLQTGVRVSELINIRRQDVHLDAGAHIRCIGKGRKTRCIPLRRETIATLRGWLRERKGQPEHVLFPNARNYPLSPDGVQYLLRKHVAAACQRCPSLKSKRVSPHVLRHSTAMDLLQHGVDRSVIALWLGHERMETTQVYLHASIELKEKALSKTEHFKGNSRRYRPPDQLLEFLNNL
jgi:integrase/recombinase XerD